MNNDIKCILKEVVNIAKSIYGNKLIKVILYGSYAKELYDEESDIDIMFLVDTDDIKLKKYEKQLNDTIADISYRYIKLISVVDMSYEKFSNWVDIVPYYKNVSEQGVVLYAA